MSTLHAMSVTSIVILTVLSQPNWPKDITWPRLIIDNVCSSLVRARGLISKNYSLLGTLGPAGVDVNGTNNYWHKVKKNLSICKVHAECRCAKEIFFVFFFSLSLKQRALEKHLGSAINPWKETLVYIENNLCLLMHFHEPSVCLQILLLICLQLN